jgi:hypothetical protein
MSADQVGVPEAVKPLMNCQADRFRTESSGKRNAR